MPITNSAWLRWAGVWCVTLTFASFPTVAGQDAAVPPTQVGEVEEPKVLFNFKGQSWDQVLDYFSRTTGMPIVRDAPIPAGTVDYINPTPYPLAEALETLNLLLQTQGVVLRQDDGRLILESLESIRRENIPTFLNDLPADVSGDQVVTIILPLVNAECAGVAEKLKDMVASFGLLLALPDQNSVLLIDTAANVRRIKKVIDELDREDLENVVEHMPLRYAEAAELLPILTSLMSERVVEMVTQGKKQVRVEKDRMPAGFNITADPRTNAIIGRGKRSRLERLRAAITMLDGPDLGAGSGMQTIQLNQMTPAEAQGQLNQLFAGIPAAKRPTSVLLNATNQITIVGNPQLLQQGARFLADQDGGGSAGNTSSFGTAVKVLTLEHLPADRAIQIIQAVFTPRQRAQIRMVTAPGGKQLLVAGPQHEIDFVENTLKVVDSDADTSRMVRYLEVNAPDPMLAIDRATLIHETGAGGDPGLLVTTSFDAAERRLVLTGSPDGIASFELALKAAEASIEPTRVVRRYSLAFVEPSDMAKSLELIAERMLVSDDSQPYVKPEFQGIDELDTLVVVAMPAQVDAIEAMTKKLDVDSLVEEPPLRLVQLFASDVKKVAQMLLRRYDMRAAEQRRLQPVRIDTDEATNTLMVTAPDAIFKEISEFVETLNRNSEDQADRETLIFPLKLARASDLASALSTLYPEPPMPLDTRGRPLPHLQKPREVFVSADPGTNTLIIEAPAERKASFELLVEQLDRVELPPQAQLRTWAIASGDGKAIVKTIELLATTGVLSEARTDGGKTVDVTAQYDEKSRTLIVAGDATTFAKVDEILESLGNGARLPTTSMRVFHLSVARAEPLGEMLDSIIKTRVQETVPGASDDGVLDRLVQVTVDRKTNTIILTAPEEVLTLADQVVKALDETASVLGEAKVHVLPVRHADATDVAASLSDLFMETADGEEPPVIRVNGSSNALLIRATPEQFVAIESVAKGLDAAAANVARELRTISIDPNRGRAEAIAQMLEQMLDKPGDDRVRIVPLEDLLKETTKDREEEPKKVSFYGVPATIAAVCMTSLGGQAEEDDPAEILVAIDPETNSLVVLGTPRQLAQFAELAAQAQAQLPQEGSIVRVVELPESIDATAIAQLVNQTLEMLVPAGGNRADVSRRSSIVADRQGQSLLITCRASDFTIISEIIAAAATPRRLDGVTIRAFRLREVSASRIAAGLQALLSRAGSKQYRELAVTIDADGIETTAIFDPRRVAVVPDMESNTLLVLAPSKAMGFVDRFVAMAEEGASGEQTTLRLFTLEHARAEDLKRTLGEIFLVRARNRTAYESTGHIEPAFAVDARSNTLLITAAAEELAEIDALLVDLDTPTPENERRTVRHYRLAGVDIEAARQVIEDAMGAESSQNTWWGRSRSTPKGKVSITADYMSSTLLVVGNATQQADVRAIIEGLGTSIAGVHAQVEVIPIEFTDASTAARAVERFLQSRSSLGGGGENVAISAIPSAGVILVSGSAEDIATVKELIAKIDRPDLGREREIELIALERGEAQTIARLVGEQFSRRGGDGVLITADVRTNSLLINAPMSLLPQVKALVTKLDAPDDTTESVIRTYTLTSANAADAVRVLRETLRLDRNGRTDGISIVLEDAPEGTPPIEVRATIIADDRSNSLVVTATEESLPVIESIIQRLEDAPAVSPIEYRVVILEHAPAADLSWTLQSLLRSRGADWGGVGIDYNRLENQLIIGATSDQFDVIDDILAELDIPTAHARRTDFIALDFAEAGQLRSALDNFYGPFAAEADTAGKQNVRIIADESTNSLVVTAPEAEWPGILALVAQLDSSEYDSSLQLKVMPLVYADAKSVAKAINDAFQPTVANGRGNTNGRRANNDRGDPRDDRGDRRGDSATVLIQGKEWVSASAEQQTNSLIISANRKNMMKIEAIIEQLDVPEFAKLPPPRLIPVAAGDPKTLAESLRTMYVVDERARGGMAIRIVGDQAANAVIVRADDEDFAQIAALADALQQTAETNGLSVRVLSLLDAPAARVAEALRAAFAAKAKHERVPLTIQIDPSANALVVASTRPMFDEIEAVVAEMDRLAPAAGQGIYLIELENIPAAAAEQTVRQLGLDRPQPAGSSSRIVIEPIKITRMASRNALLIVANPADEETIIGIFKSIDTPSSNNATNVRVIALEHARAQAVATMVRQLLNTSEQGSTNAFALAVQEQIRRLNVWQGDDVEPFALDLTKPIQIVPDAGSNAIIVTSTEANTRALVEIVGLFDRLPMTEAVTIQLFPLENMAASRFVMLVNQLFARGRSLATIDGTNVPGMPEGSVGPALLEEIVLTIDDRTNTVIAAGKESAVALVEVLKSRLDLEIGMGWVEPTIIELEYADPVELAAVLEEILIKGSTDLPGASPMQAQVARLRTLRSDTGPSVESDVFVPLSRLVIEPQEQLNALLVVGSAPNVELIEELVAMLDIKAAAPSALARIYPVEHGSAERLATLIRQLFQQQYRSKLIREEDLLTAIPDARTNALIVSTSERSFVVFEELLERLDTEVPVDYREIKVLELATASAARLGPMIQKLMDARLERLGKVQPETADLERAMILSDTRANALVVAAGEESFEVIKRLVADLDLGSVGDAEEIHVIPVTKGGLDRVAETVRKVMDRRYADLPNEIARRTRPLVMTDPRTSSLLVAAAEEDLRAIEMLVERLAMTPSNPSIAIDVITLESASAKDLAPRVESLMRERARSLGDAQTDADRVSVEVDEASNSLVVAASEENQDVVRELVTLLVEAENERTGGQLFEIIPVARNRARDLVALIDDLYADQERRRRGDHAVRVSADNRINAILASGSPSDIRAIQNLVARLDGERPGTVVEVRYVPLASANVLETVSLIENVLNGSSSRGSSNQIGTVLRYLQEIEGEEHVEVDVSSAIRESISLTPDVRTNTVIVTAPKESMQLIVRMIEDLDQSSTGAKRIEVFKLVNADARATATLLTDLFQLRQQGNLYVLKPREDVGGGTSDVGGKPSPAGDGGLFSTDLTLVPDERQALSVTVDSRTNSLIVSGTPKYLELVSEVILDLDAVETNIRDTYVYQLRNAQADEIAEVVSQFVAEDQRKFIQTLGDDQLPSAARLLEREVTIVGDVKSNSILVSASPQYMEQVKAMIGDLDIDPPQVVIEVLLAEITLSNDEDWGLTLNGDVGRLPLSAGFQFSSTDVIAGNPVVGSFSIGQQDLNLVLAAMQAQGRVQILSNPSITVANNEDGRIQVGQTIRVPNSLATFDTGAQTSSVTEVEIGTILEVRPSINPDGFVRLRIRPELSRLEKTELKISENFSSPIITKRTATTTVTVKSGETIVIGGLIQEILERTDKKIPFLGDIPWLGELFKSHIESTERREVLIVLTPHVITTPGNGMLTERTRKAIDALPLPKAIREELEEGSMRGSERMLDDDFESADGEKK
jgi:type II secretion system protein D